MGRRGLARLKRLIRNQQFMGSNPIGGFYINLFKNKEHHTAIFIKTLKYFALDHEPSIDDK
jgi:hypothetical protein